MIHLSYERAKNVQFLLEERLRECKDVFLDFPKNKFGFTTDKVRYSREYREATRNYENAHRALLQFNDEFYRQFKAEIRQEKSK